MRVWYCDRKCQTEHWKTSHKAVCIEGQLLDRADPKLETAREWMRTSGFTDTNPLWMVRLATFRGKDLGICAHPDCRVRMEQKCQLQVTVNVKVLTNAGLVTKQPIEFCCTRCSINWLGKYSSAKN